MLDDEYCNPQHIEFTATRYIRCMAPMSPIICQPGDTVVVKGWYCERGPTAIKVGGKPHCIPFSWLEEAGFPSDAMQRILQL